MNLPGDLFFWICEFGFEVVASVAEEMLFTGALVDLAALDLGDGVCEATVDAFGGREGLTR